MNEESLLLSLGGAVVREQACDFLIEPASPVETARKLDRLRRRLIVEIAALARAAEPKSNMIKLIQLVRNLKGKF